MSSSVLSTRTHEETVRRGHFPDWEIVTPAPIDTIVLNVESAKGDISQANIAHVQPIVLANSQWGSDQESQDDQAVAAQCVIGPLRSGCDLDIEGVFC